MKNWTKAFASTAFIAIGSLALATSAYGQDEFEAIPTNCIIRADEVVVNDQIFLSVGTMDLSPLEVFEDADGINWMTLNNDGFSAQSEDQALGIITWELDEDRPVDGSFLRSNQADALFPATVQLNFNVRATISTLGEDRVFLSTTPISISSSNVQSWPPGELSINSVDDANIEFVDASGEGFIVNRVRSQVRD